MSVPSGRLSQDSLSARACGLNQALRGFAIVCLGLTCIHIYVYTYASMHMYMICVRMCPGTDTGSQPLVDRGAYMVCQEQVQKQRDWQRRPRQTGATVRWRRARLSSRRR